MAEIVDIVDEEGNSFLVKKYNGHFFSPLTIGNVENQLNEIKNMSIRKDDAFLLSYPRCGTHWTREIINMLQRGEATYIPKDVPDVPVDFLQIEHLDKMTSPRPLFAHLYFQYLPKQFIENKGKIVHVTRNPKDCAVSLYNLLTKFNDPTNTGDAFYKGSWNQFVKLFCQGKSTHWTREIINMLQRGEATYIPKDVPDVPVDFLQIEHLDKMTSPRPLFAHLYFQYLPKQFIENKGKIVHVTRNPKDCAVSLYNLLTKFNDPTNTGDAFYKGSWNQFVKLFCQGKTPMGSFIEYHKQLEKAVEIYPIHTLYYENLKQDPVHEIKKIADFLEVPYTDKLIQDIAQKCKFTALQKEKTDKKTAFFVESSLDGTEIFYRKGEVGDWKNWFTVAQNEMFDKWLETGMKDSRFKFQYSL